MELSEKEEKGRNLTEKMIEDALKCGLWSLETLDQELAGKSTYRQKAALRTQISLATKVIGMKCDEHNVAVTKASVNELKNYLLQLLGEPLSASQQNLVNILRDPGVLVGRTSSHTWSVGGQPVSFDIIFLKHIEAADELQIQCEGEEPYFLTTSEVLTDVMRGDMVLT